MGWPLCGVRVALSSLNGEARLRANRLFGLGIQALARRLLSAGCPAEPLVRALRGDVRHGRDQQYLLSTARRAHLRRVGSTGAGPVPLCREGKPVPHPHEEAEGSGRAARAPVHPDASPGDASRARCSINSPLGGPAMPFGWSTSWERCRRACGTSWSSATRAGIRTRSSHCSIATASLSASTICAVQLPAGSVSGHLCMSASMALPEITVAGIQTRGWRAGRNGSTRNERRLRMFTRISTTTSAGMRQGTPSRYAG